MQEDDKRTARLNHRVTPEFKARIAVAAAKQNRSVSNYIEVVVERELIEDAQETLKEWENS